MAFLIMFVTPLFAHGIGASPEDSLVWCSRSVTTAIGIVIADVLGANQSVVTCIIVFTGIMGPLFGDALFRLARVKKGKLYYIYIYIFHRLTNHE
jgi:putative effector of murein hydrolase